MKIIVPTPSCRFISNVQHRVINQDLSQQARRPAVARYEANEIHYRTPCSSPTFLCYPTATLRKKTAYFPEANLAFATRGFGTSKWTQPHVYNTVQVVYITVDLTSNLSCDGQLPLRRFQASLSNVWIHYRTTVCIPAIR